MYAFEDSPTVGPPGNGNSQVKIDGEKSPRARRVCASGHRVRLAHAPPAPCPPPPRRAVTLTRVSARYSGLIQVLVFHSDNLDYVGYLEPGAQQVRAPSARAAAARRAHIGGAWVAWGCVMWR